MACRTEMVCSVAQPVFWILLFGSVVHPFSPRLSRHLSLPRWNPSAHVRASQCHYHDHTDVIICWEIGGFSLLCKELLSEQSCGHFPPKHALMEPLDIIMKYIFQKTESVTIQGVQTRTKATPQTTFLPFHVLNLRNGPKSFADMSTRRRSCLALGPVAP